jgi:probable F420-dependent oxidoreductase
MQLSTGLMARGRLGSPELLEAIGRAADEVGLPRVWFGDHVVYPVAYRSAYPSASGKIDYNTASAQSDVIVAMTWLCAATDSVGVGTSVMVVAQRQLVWLAKQLATLDVLSGGRLTLGIGVGWCAEEFESLGVPFAERGARTDEYMDAMRVLWTEETPSYSGRYVSFPPLYCNPKPVQAGGPPIWVGGGGKAALERVARYGAGWVPGGRTPEELARDLAWIRNRAAELGRTDAEEIGMLAQGVWRPDRDDLRLLLRDLRAAGVTEAIVPVQGKTPEEARDFVRSIPELLDDN